MKKIVTLAMLAAIALNCKEPEQKKIPHAAAVILVVGADAKVTTTSGTAKIVKGAMLYEGHKVQTGPKSQVDLLIPGNILMRIGENTSIDLTDFSSSANGQKDTIYLRKGMLFAKVSKLGAHSTFAIKTPTVVAGVRGTEFMTTSDEKGAGKVAVTEGTVAVKGDIGDEKAITSGEQANVSESGSVAETKIDDATAAQMKQLSTVKDISAQQMQIFEDALKQQKEILEKAGGTDKIKGIIEENDKKMQEKRDEATKKVEEQKSQTENKIQEMNKSTTEKIEQMKNSVDEQKKKRDELFNKIQKK